MLIFPLKKQWYENIKSGEKTIEYREVKDYWTKRIRSSKCENNIGDIERLFEGKIACLHPLIKPCCELRLGYTNRFMTAKITQIEIVDGKDTDLHIDKPVYAIHLTDVKEVVDEA